MIQACRVASAVAFVCAALCALGALRHARRCQIRAVLDDLSGRRRQCGIEEELADRMRLQRTGARVDRDPVTQASREKAAWCDEPSQTVVDGGDFVLVGKLVLVGEGASRSVEEG